MCFAKQKQENSKKAAAYKQNKKEDSDGRGSFICSVCGKCKKSLKEKADIEICEEKFYTENKDVQSLELPVLLIFSAGNPASPISIHICKYRIWV